MMRPDAKVEKVYLYPKPVDFRKSIDGLAALVELDIKVAVFDPAHARGVAPCYRCLFPQPPGPGEAPNCAEAGVLGVLPGVIGLLQATEVLKLLLGLGESLSGRLLHFDALAMRFRETRLRADPACPACAPGRPFTGYDELEQACRAQARGGA